MTHWPESNYQGPPILGGGGQPPAKLPAQPAPSEPMPRVITVYVQDREHALATAKLIALILASMVLAVVLVNLLGFDYIVIKGMAALSQLQNQR